MYSRFVNRIILLVVLCFKLQGVSGQSQKAIIPPSPKSAEFVKYVNFEVSPYNGLPEISIPLYSIKLKNLTIPINLTYHASGIKFKQDNGEVGVGWTLNPGYRVSRTVYGYADEKEAKPDNYLDSLGSYSNLRQKTDQYLSKFLPYGIAERPFTLSGGQLDGEFDIFNYNIASDAGSFIITDRVNKKIKTLKHSNTQIEYTTGLSSNGFTSGIIGLSLTDTEGNKFFMGEASGRGNNYVFETSAPGYGGGLSTAWALTDIETFLGEKVQFNYSKSSSGGWVSHNETLGISEAMFSNLSDMFDSEMSIDEEGFDGTYQTFVLDKILTPNEVINISRQGSNTGKLVSEMEIRTTANLLVRKVQFFYSVNSHHTFLDSVRVLDESEVPKEVYKFQYVDKSTSGIFVADQWGYYLPAGHSKDKFHFEIGQEALWTKLNGYGSFSKMNRFITTSKRDYIPMPPDVFTLKRIILPSGGTTEYEYESNKFGWLNNEIKIGGGIRIKRIRNIDNHTGSTVAKEYRYGRNESGYGDPSLYIDYRDFVNESMVLKLRLDAYDMYVPVRRLTYSTQMQGDADPGGLLSSYVIYPSVTEYDILNNATNDIGKVVYNYDLGHRFNIRSFAQSLNQNNYQYYGLYPQYIHRYRYWDTPRLIEQLSFKKIGDSYALSKKSTFNFTSSFQSYNGLKVRDFATARNYTSLHSFAYYEHLSSFFKYSEYTIEAGQSLLTEQSDISYDGADSISTLTSFEYNSKNQISKQIVTTGSDKQIITYNKYPQDIVGIPNVSSNYQTNPVGFLVSRNVISKPIETYNSVKRSGSENIVSGNLTTYKGQLLRQAMPAVLPSREYQFATPSGVAIDGYNPLSITTSANGEVVNMDTRFEERLRYDLYDEDANVIQYTENEKLKGSYQWGYNGQYPIFQIKNASIGEFYFCNFEDIGNSSVAHSGVKGWSGAFPLSFSKPDSRVYYVSWKSLVAGKWLDNKQIYTGQSISGNIDDICIYPSDSEMSYFTYKPLVGMSSATTSSGLTTFYDYDSYQRLATISNGERDVVKRFNYNFQNRAGIYFNLERSITLKRNNCPTGFASSPAATYTVYPGTYTSTVSQTAADNLAENDLTTNSQNYANATCACLKIYYSEAVSASFVKTNCPTGTPPGQSVLYSVPAGKYTSLESQDDANSRAMVEVNTLGQAYANENGMCGSTFYSVEKSGYFSRNNCGANQSSGPSVLYRVPAGTFSSTTSQAAADNLAQQDVNNNGQTYANTHGTCVPNVGITLTTFMYSGNVQSISFSKDGYNASFNPVNNGVNQVFNIPQGIYRVIIQLTEDPEGTRYVKFSSNGGGGSLCYPIQNSAVVFDNISIQGSSNNFAVEDFCY